MGDRGIYLDDLFELNMLTCTWTQIQTNATVPRARSAASWNAISDGQLVLHGGWGPIPSAEIIPPRLWLCSQADSQVASA